MGGGRDASTVFLCLGVIVAGLIFVIAFCAWCGTRRKRHSGFQTSYGFQLVQILSRGRGDTDNTLTTPSQQQPVTVTDSSESSRTNQGEHSPRRSSENTNGVTNVITRESDRRSFFTLVRPRASTPVTPSRSTTLAIPSSTTTLAIPSRTTTLAIPSRTTSLAIPSRTTTLAIPSIATTPAVPQRRVTDNTESVSSSNAWADIDLNAVIPSLSNPSTHLSAQHGPPRIAPFVPPPRRTRRPASPTEPTAPLLPSSTYNVLDRTVRPANRTEPTAPVLPSATRNEPERTLRPTNRPFSSHTSQFHAPERVSISSFGDSGSSRFQPPPGYHEIDRFENPEDLHRDPLPPPSYDEVMSQPHIYPKR